MNVSLVALFSLLHLLPDQVEGVALRKLVDPDDELAKEAQDRELKAQENRPHDQRLNPESRIDVQAEAHGKLGDDGAAAAALGDAIDFHSDRDLMRHVAKARQRYFKNGRPGS